MVKINGQRLKEILANAGWTMSWASQRIGMNPDYIRKAIGRGTISEDALKHIYQLLGGSAETPDLMSELTDLGIVEREKTYIEEYEEALIEYENEQQDEKFKEYFDSPEGCHNQYLEAILQKIETVEEESKKQTVLLSSLVEILLAIGDELGVEWEMGEEQ